jgi:PAS domain-containing protein
MSLDDLHRELAGGDLISRGGDLLSPPPGRELAMRGLISSPPGRELAGRDMKGDIFSPLPGLPALPWAATTGAGAHVQGAAGGGVTPLNVSAGLALACQASLLGRTLQLYGGVVQVVTEPGPPYRIISVSAGWERMCGYSHNEVVGKSLSFLQVRIYL